MYFHKLKPLLSLALIFILVMAPISITLAQDSEGDDEGKGEGEGGAESAPDADGDGMSDADEGAAAEAAAEGVATNADAMGVDVSVSAVDAANNPDSVADPADPNSVGVTVNGITMSVEAANEAIASIAEAQNQGLSQSTSSNVPGIDTQATLEAHAQGMYGAVVGSMSGVVGSASEVADAEAEYAGRAGAVDSALSTLTDAEFDARFGSDSVVPSENLSDAITQSYQQFAESAKAAGITNLSGTTQIDPNGYSTSRAEIGAYQEYASVMGQSGNLSLSGTTNTSFTYDSETGNFVGKQNGMTVEAIDVPYSANVTTIARQNPESLVTIDLTVENGVISTQNLQTGRVNNFDAETANVIDSQTLSHMFSTTPIGPLTGNSLWGDDTLGKFNTLSPMQKAILGEPVTNDITNDDIAEFAETFSAILSAENAPIAGKIGRGEALTDEEMAEAIAIVGVAINRGAASGKTALSFAIDDNKTYTNWQSASQQQLASLEQNPNFSKANIESFYSSLFTGKTATQSFSKASLEDMTPAAFATHYSNPSQAKDKSQGVYAVPGTQVTLGQHVFSQQYTKERTAIEYSVVAKGLPSYVDEVAVQQADLMSVVGMSDGLTSTSPNIPGNNEPSAVNTVDVNTSCDCVNEAITGTSRPLGVNTSYAEQLDQAMKIAQTKHPELGLKITIFSGTQKDPDFDPAKGNHGSGRHAKGNGGDVSITDKNGNKVTDPAVMQDVVEAVATVNPRSGIGYNSQSQITHVDFEPNPHNSYHGTWSYGAVNPAMQAAYERGAVAHEGKTVTASADYTSSPTGGGNTATKNPGSRGSNIGKNIGGVVAGPIGSIVGGLLGKTLGDILGRLPENPNSTPNTNPFQSDNNCSNDPQAEECAVSSTNMGAMLWASAQNLPYIIKLVNNLISDNWHTEEVPSTPLVSDKIIIPVTITINNQNKSIDITREDILTALEENREYYTESPREMASMIAIMEATPLVFDDQGRIIYSNGIYSPAVKDGREIDTGIDYEYLYTLRYVNGEGNYTELNNSNDMSVNNFVTDTLHSLFIAGTPFNYSDLQSVTYTLIDPDRNIAGDEYYDYNLTLKNGDSRGITTPQFSSITGMRDRFASIGYRDEVIKLLTMAEEKPPEENKSLVREALDRLYGAINIFSDIIRNTDEPISKITELPTVDRLNSDKIKTVFIYPTSNVPCPTDVEGYSAGFMYTALVQDPEDINYAYSITDGRCGFGNPTDLITETALHLEQVYGINNASYDSIKTKTIFRSETAVFSPGITKVALNRNEINENTDNTPEEIGTDQTPTETPAASSTTQLSNLTNTISFEVKAVGANGNIITDWTNAESIEISSGVQLYFRWNGDDYQQCLPFLNDNGNYSIMVRNRAMITGNTESENYNVPELSAIYRVECGGQRNNEFGVDFREVEVKVD